MLFLLYTPIIYLIFYQFYSFLRDKISQLFLLPAQEKVVFISGCDTGFGFLTAKELARLGYKVLAGCYTEKGRKELETITNIIPIELDISKEDSIEVACDEIKKHCPNGLWALINNAGIFDGIQLEFTPVSIFRRVMEINLFGHISITKRLVPLLRKTRGRVVNMASIAGRLSHHSLGAYVASKHAMVGWSNCIRDDLGKFGITVICIQPGFMKTPIVNSMAQIQRLYDAAPKEITQHYGGEAFLEQYQKGMSTISQTAEDPMKVVHCYVNAVTSAYPKPTYVVGTLSSTMIFLANVFPPFVFSKISQLFGFG